MQKYVYEKTENLTREELIKKVSKINYVDPKKEEIMKMYGFSVDNVNLEEVEATIEVSHYYKSMEDIFSIVDFSYIYDDLSSQDYEKNKNRILDILKLNGINLDYENILLFCKCVVALKEDKNILEDLNSTKNITVDILSNILEKFNIEKNDDVIRELHKFIVSMTNQQSIYLPILREKYYDENDSVSYGMKVEIPEKNETNLRGFSGEIYEKLDFKNDEEAKQFVIDNNIKHDLDEEITTYIHFEGEEVLDNWVKVMDIKKQKNTIIIWYGEPLIVISKSKGSINPYELELVISEIKIKTPKNEFSKYVIKELKGLRNAIRQRKGYVRSAEDNINRETLKKVSEILANENYGDDKNIFFKCKIISSEPLQIEKAKQKKLVF